MKLKDIRLALEVSFLKYIGVTLYIFIVALIKLQESMQSFKLVDIRKLCSLKYKTAEKSLILNTHIIYIFNHSYIYMKI